MQNPGSGMGRHAGSIEAQAGSMGAQAGSYYQQPPQAQGRGSGSGSGSNSQHHRMQGETSYTSLLWWTVMCTAMVGKGCWRMAVPLYCLACSTALAGATCAGGGPCGGACGGLTWVSHKSLALQLVHLSASCIALQACIQWAALSGTARRVAVVGEEAETGLDHIEHTGELLLMSPNCSLPNTCIAVPGVIWQILHLPSK